MVNTFFNKRTENKKFKLFAQDYTLGEQRSQIQYETMGPPYSITS